MVGSGGHAERTARIGLIRQSDGPAPLGDRAAGLGRTCWLEGPW
jgi:hypothetical protein